MTCLHVHSYFKRTMRYQLGVLAVLPGAETWGRRSPPKFEVGDGPCIGPPNIWRSTNVVLSDARERMNRVKKGLIKEFFSEIVVFLSKKESYMTFYRSKQRKIRKTRSMTKKRSSEILGVKVDIFFVKKVIQKSWSAKNFSVPPNSAPGLRR